MANTKRVIIILMISREYRYGILSELGMYVGAILLRTKDRPSHGSFKYYFNEIVIAPIQIQRKKKKTMVANL